MPVRFRRTYTLFPGVKVNVSKGGMSITVGTKGFHLNFSKQGVRQTTGLAGSGISHTSYLFKNDDDEKVRRIQRNDLQPQKKRTRSQSDSAPSGASENGPHRPGGFSSLYWSRFSFFILVQMPLVYFPQIWSQIS